MDPRFLSRLRKMASLHPDATCIPRKRARHSSSFPSDGGDISATGCAGEFFDRIPDDLIILVLSKLSSSATCPSDFINARLSCKRFYSLCLNCSVLAKASAKLLAVNAKKWSESAHRFLWRCASSGNMEACYVLGMIRFYCLGHRASGVSLMAKAAIRLHAPAIYSLAVIQFNGSGSSRHAKHIQAAVALCACAASLGHLDAIREFGHCLQDGYGVRQNVLQGRRFLIHANYNEIVGMEKAENKPHPVNIFMADWFEPKLEKLRSYDLRLCSNRGCGRPETRRNEFRRCSMCVAVHYCSRACQAQDWKISHKMECAMVAERWLIVQLPAVALNAAAAAAAAAGGLEEGEEV